MGKQTLIRLKFDSDKDRIRGNYLLVTKTTVHRLRGQIFEISEDDLRILDEHNVHYRILPSEDIRAEHEEIRDPIAVKL